MDETILFKGDIEVARLPLQMTWLHVCVAVSCDKRQLSAVFNGVKVLDTQFEGTDCPTSLVGNLVLMKAFLASGIWMQARGRVTNVNVFSGLMSQDQMVSRTSGEECGKQDGDLLSWKDSSWSLRGNDTKWMDVSVEDLCLEFSSIQLFTTSGVKEPDDCKYLCQRMHKDGRMASVETTDLFTKLKERVRSIPNTASDVMWLPISKQKDIWVDSHTGTRISKTAFNPGYPVNDTNQECGVYTPRSEGYINYECSTVGATGGARGWYCVCHFPKHPFLTLRGRCKDSFLDETYLPQNSPLDGETTFYGNTKTIARFLREDNRWRVESSFYKTTALSKEISGRFMLGKQNWTIDGDSKKCHNGKPYIAEMKLTRCTEGEFTCDDGQCIEMERRCDQVTGREPNCRDESDENGCQLIVFKNNYNKNIPPIGQANDGSVVPADVSISITLMKVVEIEEVEHSIHLQFEISLKWKEIRVKYKNLKDKTSLNALTDDDILNLWLPRLRYENTDQKVSTRLGEYGNGEWITTVTVTREGNFTRSGFGEVDEAELFEGANNRLTMNQTYTWEFQCNYKLQLYPFDTQVIRLRILFSPSQECKIEMGVATLASDTVRLFTNKVIRQDIVKHRF